MPSGPSKMASIARAPLVNIGRNSLRYTTSVTRVLEAAELVAPTVGAATFRAVPVLHMASSQACTNEGSSEAGREECWVVRC